MDCIFCKIAQGELPANKVAETERFVAFLDISPVNEGHTLIVPKEHHENLLDLPPALGEELLGLAQRVGKAILENTDADGFNFLLNNGPAAGQVVFHAHFHVVPRIEGDGKMTLHNGGDHELEGVAQKLRSSLGDR